MKCTVLSLAALLAVSASAETLNLNADWRFAWANETIPLKNAMASMAKDGVAVSDPSYDDSSWEPVSVPHPVNAHDTFDNHACDPGEASFRRGMMFYRKRFVLSEGRGKREEGRETREEGRGKAFLTFETVRQTVYVWVNGKFAGYYEAGIAPCAFDVTELLEDGGNVVCVATDNTAMRGAKLFAKETIPDGRHEPGDMSGQSWQWNTTDFNEVQGGLVGDVSLVVKPSKTYLTLPYYNNLKTVGTYVTAKDFDFEKGAATICVKAEVRNEDVSRRGAVAQRFKIKAEVREAGTAGTTGTKPIVTVVSSVVDVPSSPAKTFLTALESDVYGPSPAPTRVNSPDVAYVEARGCAEGLVFWSPDTPHLYDVVVTLLDARGKVLNRETIRTGFREVTYDAAKGGLLVKGKHP